MRILHVNKFNAMTGGVETVVHSLMAAQERNGDVTDIFSSEDLPRAQFDAAPTGPAARLRTARSVIWNASARAALAERIRLMRPDIVHFHSVYHQLSPSVLAQGRQMGVATVLSLHDYKTVAPCYVLLRDGRRCVECVGRRVPWPAVQHRCVKGSVSGSITCALEDVVHRRTYANAADVITVPSEASLRIHVQHGLLPVDRLRVVPWGVDCSGPVADPARSRRVIFVGRLSAEKGPEQLVSAWRQVSLQGDWHLLVVGDGPLRDRVRTLAAGYDSISFAGQLPRGELLGVCRSAAILVMPSQCDETFGLAAAEGMAAGVPVLASRIGGLPELIRDGIDGVLVGAQHEAEWVAALERLMVSPELRLTMGQAARERVRSLYSTDRMQSGMQSTYEAAGLRANGFHRPWVGDEGS